jgi:hypothetical protein
MAERERETKNEMAKRERVRKMAKKERERERERKKERERERGGGYFFPSFSRSSILLNGGKKNFFKHFFPIVFNCCSPSSRQKDFFMQSE